MKSFHPSRRATSRVHSFQTGTRAQQSWPGGILPGSPTSILPNHQRTRTTTDPSGTATWQRQPLPQGKYCPNPAPWVQEAELGPSEDQRAAGGHKKPEQRQQPMEELSGASGTSAPSSWLSGFVRSERLRGSSQEQPGFRDAAGAQREGTGKGQEPAGAIPAQAAPSGANSRRWKRKLREPTWPARLGFPTHTHYCETGHQILLAGMKFGILAENRHG